MELFIRSGSVDDLALLCQLGSQTFYETFCHLNTPANMAAYLEKAFNRRQMESELSDRHSSFYLMYADGELAGYLKLNEHPAQTDLKDPVSLELERIYVSQRYQGCGLGQKLMDKALEVARQKGKDYVWLGVWEKNQAARAFYARNNFYEAGTHTFVIGDDVQNDYILRRDCARC